MVIDLFDTRTMTAALVELRKPLTFFLDTFFQKEEIHDTETVDIDVIRNKRRLAPFVNPLSEGKLMEHSGYSTKTFRPPYIKPKMVTTAADMLKRAIGQTIYSNQTPEQRSAERLAMELLTLSDSITRREEWMAAQALMTGSVTVLGEGLNAVINYGYSSSHLITLSGTALWTNAAGNPLQNFRDWKRIATQDSGLVPTDAVFSSDALTAFFGNAEVRAELARFQNQQVAISMDTSDLANGVAFVGRVEGLNIWTYDEWYLDDSGVEQPMIPSGKVLLGSRNADCRRHYGAILDLSSLASVKQFAKSWLTDDPSARWVMVQSAPLPVPHQIDAFVLASVI